VDDGDVERLREAGLDDEGVLHVVEVVSYFNFVNRMADGLGVRLEEAWPHPIIGEPDELHGGEDRADDD
jgi:uncharacterized protein YciW